MKSTLARRIAPALLALSLTALISCGGAAEQKEASQQACPTCPVCNATPTPSAQDLQQELEKLRAGLLEKNSKKFRANPEDLKSAAAQFGISDKIGKKEVIAEDFPKFVNFFWAVDSEFRIQYLRAMMTTNRLVEMVKPATGKFDINVAPKDLEAEDVSLLISQAIVDWAQVQRTLEDDFMGFGIENVMGVLPSEDLPQAGDMMKDLLQIVAPPMPVPTPTMAPLPIGPKSAGLPLLNWLEGNAWAQQAKAKAKPDTLPVHSKAVPRVKVMQAPFLLARVLSFKVGAQQIFVLQSPLMAAEPAFQAIAVDQFHFALEKMTVGPGYRDAVQAKVDELAAKPKRDIVDWWQFSHGATELRLVDQLVDYNKLPPQSTAPSTATTPAGPATTTPGTTSPGTAPSTERPGLPSGAQPGPAPSEPHPSGAQGQQPLPNDQPRPSAPSGAIAPGTPSRTDSPAAAQPSAPSAPSRADTPSGAPPSAPASVPRPSTPAGSMPGPDAAPFK